MFLSFCNLFFFLCVCAARQTSRRCTDSDTVDAVGKKTNYRKKGGPQNRRLTARCQDLAFRYVFLKEKPTSFKLILKWRCTRPWSAEWSERSMVEVCLLMRRASERSSTQASQVSQSASREAQHGVPSGNAKEWKR